MTRRRREEGSACMYVCTMTKTERERKKRRVLMRELVTDTRKGNKLRLSTFIMILRRQRGCCILVCVTM